MLTNLLCFMSGMIVMWLLSYVMSVGHSVNIINKAQRYCALLLIEAEQGLQEILQLKYLAMTEAKRSEQNITAQKYIDQMNLLGVKKTIMRNYTNSFPENYKHSMQYSTWDELEKFVNKVVQEEKAR